MVTDAELIDALRRELGQLHPPADLLERVYARARAPQRPRHVRPRRISVGTLVMVAGVAVALAVGVVALVLIHHRTPTVKPSSTPRSSAKIAAVVADPAGGLPWAIRVVHSGRLTCVQLGRLDHGSLGVIGQDGAFSNDGRFHPIAPSTTLAARCVQNDSAGHAYLDIVNEAQPANGVVPTVVSARRPALCPAAICPQRDLRIVQYGLLGPGTASITYKLPSGLYTSATGAAGAFLIVAAQTQHFCQLLVGEATCPAGTAIFPKAELSTPLIENIRYRDGRISGYQPPPTSHITPSQVASTITVQRLPGYGPYCGNDQGGPWHVCKPGQTPLLGTSGVVLDISFIARLPAHQPHSLYVVRVRSPRCSHGRSRGATDGRILGSVAAGTRITIHTSAGCPGIYRGTVGYIPNTGRGSQPEWAPGIKGWITVGTFTSNQR